MGVNDGRPDEPYVSPERWAEELKRAGFATPDVVLDSPTPYHSSAVFIARPEEDVNKATKKNVTVVSYSQDGKNVDAVTKKLENRGFTVSKSSFGDDLPRDSQAVISLLDEEIPFFEDIDEQRFEALKRLVASIGERGLFWVTRPAQMQSFDPRYATVIGAIRYISVEDTIDFGTCVVQNVSQSLDEVVDTFAHFQNRHISKIGTFPK